MKNLISSEYTFAVDHAHTLSYYDKRGELVKKNKKIFKFIDPTAKVDKLVRLASSEEEEIEGYFSPEDFSTRLHDLDQRKNFYEQSAEFSNNIISSLGLEGYIDKVRFTIVLTIKIDKDIREFMEDKGFIVKLPNDLIPMRSNLRTLFIDPDNGNVYALSIQEMTLGDNHVNIDLTYIFSKDELESEENLLDKEFHHKNFTELEKLLMKLNLVEGL
ncbi:hypothetical protein QJS65_13980 [Bacillus altitudinis]|uniref:hypothetical protein n=1 Tax=Bacillus altitudinis TaxID=293387 RepID=UPI0024A8C6A0|nr:hypothetical protein [Bacillus altitudinis]WHF25933.1 hypothetical protein QJS65_13980 [Bacillus altitudinis]